ncbi:MAG TPA: BrnA antitoxin family protein, partial [Aquirhabdus sp.]
MDKEYDFSNAKRATEVPHLNKLRVSQSQKSRITIMLDNDVIEGFKARAAEHGMGYQTEINGVLRKVLEQGTLEDILRRVVREEMKHA